MFGSWKRTSLRSSFSPLLRKAWNEWDVRGMVLLSLFLQITLFVLGKRRKNSVRLTSRIILWFAYISADWIAVAALGKLSSYPTESPTTGVLRALWAPLLILHLGGPDTITAYAFEDTQLWNRHILTLVVKSIFAVYVIYLSWTTSWLSLLNFPLILAGIIKYVERILCLQLINSKKTEPIIYIASVFPKEWLVYLEFLLRENPDSKVVLLAYLLFSIMRPDANDYLSSKLYLESSAVRITTYIDESVSIKEHPELGHLLDDFLGSRELKDDTLVNIAGAELEFIFDIVYTKAGLIYTKKGCFLRLTSFTCSVLVLLVFIISIMNEPKFHFSRVDIHITISLLIGAAALEFCAVFSMLSSPWAIPMMLFHASPLLRKTLQCALRHLPCLFPLQQNRWSGKIGQFNLLDYYLKTKKAKVYRFLQRNFRSNILEYWHKFNYARFVEVPSCLKQRRDYKNRFDTFFNKDDKSFEPTRGEKTLHEFHASEDIGRSIRLDFDTSIIVWHLATSVCYYQDVHHTFPSVCIEDREISKYLSDYMMYLLAMQPAFLLPEQCRSFWLDACDKLKDLFSEASSMDHALTLLLKQDASAHVAQDKSRDTPMETLQQHASKLVAELDLGPRQRKWEIMKAMWIEMLLYAAFSCQQVNHVKQLGHYSQEFLNLIWIMGVSRIVQEKV